MVQSDNVDRELTEEDLDKIADDILERVIERKKGYITVHRD